jgi:hypothetical protein
MALDGVKRESIWLHSPGSGMFVFDLSLPLVATSEQEIQHAAVKS